MLTTMTMSRRCFSSGAQRVVANLQQYNPKNLNHFEYYVKYCSAIVTFPASFITVKPNHVSLVYRFGKYDGYYEPGMNHIVSTVGVSRHEIFCGDRTINYRNLHLTDSNKNPIIISSFVSYRVVDPIPYILNVKGKIVVENWIESKYRQHVMKYSYDELTSTVDQPKIVQRFLNDMNHEDNNDQSLIGGVFYGIKLIKADILQINYAPEVCEMMLVKQRAKAVIASRKELVDATISLIHEITAKLDEKLLPEDKSKLITFLTVNMITQQGGSSNVINLN